MTNSNQKKSSKGKVNSWGTNLYVIRKYIYARSALEAFKLEGAYPADDVWLDEGFKGEKIRAGFNIK